jgi:Mannosyl-glycoprotein endo-beta-N-acetylglucosaminidase
LGVRWDYAFYQMIVETGALSYQRGNRSGDVRPAQNNFAGLGAIGRGVHGESFKDIATGVRAHLEHLLLYAGDTLQNPTAERTRKVQEWGVLTSWQARIKRPITFTDLAQQWAPGSNSYVKMLADIAERFAEFCAAPDPQPELVAEARGRKLKDTADAHEPVAKRGSELAKRAIEDGKAQENDRRSALGALDPERSQPLPFTLLNAPAVPEAGQPQEDARPSQLAATSYERTPEAKQPAAKTPAAGKMPPTSDKAPLRTASAAGVATSLAPPAQPVAGQKCRVWTASYGGQKALIIRSIVDKVVNYTVLDVNDGAEKREAEAFISAYAKDGSVAGEFASQTQALDRAFELCPEG